MHAHDNNHLPSFNLLADSLSPKHNTSFGSTSAHSSPPFPNHIYLCPFEVVTPLPPPPCPLECDSTLYLKHTAPEFRTVIHPSFTPLHRASYQYRKCVGTLFIATQTSSLLVYFIVKHPVLTLTESSTKRLSPVIYLYFYLELYHAKYYAMANASLL